MSFEFVTGINNTYVGFQAGLGVSGKSHGGCVFIGTNAGLTAYTGDDNIAIGHNAMKDVDADDTVGSSYSNIFIGSSAGGGAWTTAASSLNIGIGQDSMDAVMNGALRNVGLGKSSLSALTEGDDNVAVGVSALNQITTGAYNVAVGTNAGSHNTNTSTGVRNTLIGMNSDTSATNSDNQTVIGYDAIGVADNSVTLGDGNVTAIYCSDDQGATIYAAGLVEGSSLEIKKNISEIESPLDKITKLRGIEFDYKETDEHSIGMVAEEVNEIFPELVSKDEDGKVTAMSYSRMTAVLLEAVKELSQEVKELKMNNIYNNKERD